MAEAETADAVVIGGGAAGFFGAIHCAAARPGQRVVLLEATQRVLTKVRISGGGRCNVTHHCFEPADLVRNYPRGGRELRGPLSRFQPRDTVAWFQSRGVELKHEADGRMFPVTDDSRTIATCLETAAAAAGVEIRLGAGVTAVARDEARGFLVTLKSGTVVAARRLLLATGSAPAGFALAAALGHTVEPLVPSLFTFNIKDPRLDGLAGLAWGDAALTLTCPGAAARLEQRGPLLVTHWGLSGPAVLKLSAFGAVALHACAYQATLKVNVLPGLTAEAALAVLRAYKDAHPRQAVAKHGPFSVVPKRFWARLAELDGLDETKVYADLTRPSLVKLSEELTQGRYQVQGKGVFKDEFVTAGGVRLSEVDFRTMESRVVPGLHLAGEILDVDGITGGFNFQAAWTTGYLAGQHMGA